MKWVKLIFLIILGLFWISRIFVIAQESALKQVTATIKISVCGNGIIEGGEDCEGEDLNGQTCINLGYAGGTLSCDIACTFDTLNCIITTSTPTPTPIPTSTPSPTPVAATVNPALVSTSIPAPLTPVPTLAIPDIVAVFDIDGSGRIETTEVFTAVKSWVDTWKAALLEEIKVTQEGFAGATPDPRKIEKCDLNHDRKCNLSDLSILLYYIGR
jgi:hypothetical protein